MALVAFVEWRNEVVGKVCQIENRVLQRQVLQVLGREGVIRRALAPVSMLEDDYRAAGLFGIESRQPLLGRVCRVEQVGGLLARCEEDDGRAWSFPVGGA